MLFIGKPTRRFNPTEATLFLRTAQARPDLAARVRNLVVTLDEEEEPNKDEPSDQVEQRHIRESEELTRVLEVCPNVERFQARTIHPRVGMRFINAIKDKPRILTFIGGPRPVNPVHSWTDVTYEKPLPLVFARMTVFELDSPYAAGTRPIPLLDMPVLEGARLGCEVPEDTICAFVETCAPTVQSFYLYQERLLPVDTMLAGLRHHFPYIRRLKYHLNPSVTELEAKFSRDDPPLFDRLFALVPSYEKLEYLSVSATDISVEALKSLPPSLRHLEVHAYSEFSMFGGYSSELVDVLRDTNIDLPLKQLTVRDVSDGWAAESVEHVHQICKARGITFEFVPEDGEEEA